MSLSHIALRGCDTLASVMVIGLAWSALKSYIGDMRVRAEGPWAKEGLGWEDGFAALALTFFLVVMFAAIWL